MQPIFTDGISFYRPKDGAPEWIKGSVVIHKDRLIKFLNENSQFLSEKGFMNLDLKLSKDKNTLYFQVNTWKPTPKVEQPQEPQGTSVGYNGEQYDLSDVPFN